MAFRISARHAAADEVRRLVDQRLEKAIAALEDGSAQGIHAARKRLKETRALLRLVRQPLGKRRFRALNATLRDSGQALSGLRDAAAVLECWDALARHAPARFAEADLQAVRTALAARAQAAPIPEGGHPALIEPLQTIIDDSAAWPLEGRGFDLFGPGVLRAYRNGRRALAAVRQAPDDASLHEWRKRVKDHWYQTRLLQDAWPRVFKARKKGLQALADDLGDDHDLALLQALMAQEPALFGEPDTRADLAQAIARRRARLQTRALRRGARVYAEPPKALLKRWRRYWRVAAGHAA